MDSKVEELYAILDAYRFIIIALLIFMPFAMWKIIDIVIWIYNNVSISIT